MSGYITLLCEAFTLDSFSGITSEGNLDIENPRSLGVLSPNKLILLKQIN